MVKLKKSTLYIIWKRFPQKMTVVNLTLTISLQNRESLVMDLAPVTIKTPEALLYPSHRFQNTLPQNMAHRHIQYFKLKEFEKQQVQEGLPTSSAPPKQVIKPSCEKCSPYTQRKSLKMEECWEESKLALLSSPPVTTLSSYPNVLPQLSMPFYSLSDLV